MIQFVWNAGKLVRLYDSGISYSVEVRGMIPSRYHSCES
jgi:hypothetical protein